MEYKIVKEIYDNGTELYFVKRKVMGIFWVYFRDDLWERVQYHFIDNARNFIIRHKSDLEKKRAKIVNMEEYSVLKN